MAYILRQSRVGAMNESPAISSTLSSKSLDAVARLEHLSHEPWAIDWIKCALICKHGVAVNNLDALAMGVDVLRELIARHHSAIVRV